MKMITIREVFDRMIKSIQETITLRRKPLKDDVVILEINHAPISLGHLKFFLSMERTRAYSYFHQTYEIKSLKNFWTTSFHGEIPYQRVMKESIKHLQQVAAQHELAQAYGFSSEPSYEEFLKQWQERQTKRKQARAKGETIYGSYDDSPEDYFYKRCDQREFTIKQQLQARTSIAEHQLRHLYEKLKKNRYQKPSVPSHEQPYASFKEVREDVMNIFIQQLYDEEIKQKMEEMTIDKKPTYDVLIDRMGKVMENLC